MYAKYATMNVTALKRKAAQLMKMTNEEAISQLNFWTDRKNKMAEACIIAIAALEHQASEPEARELTREDLMKLDKKKVWCEYIGRFKSGWHTVDLEQERLMDSKRGCWSLESKEIKIYDRPPKDEGPNRQGG